MAMGESAGRWVRARVDRKRLRGYLRTRVMTPSMSSGNDSQVMSSPNHPTSNIDDAFSSPNYTLASPDYSPASSGNTPYESLNNSYGLVPISPIPPPIIVPPSPMLSPIFNPQELFVSEELLPPKKQTRLPSLSYIDFSNPSRKQACILLPPYFSTYTPTAPQIYELGKSSIKMRVKHHEELIESILNYLKEISFHYIEKMKERLVNGWIIIQEILMK
nr:hypothetical protein [Tanacetum cinerariifolium]